MICALIIGLIWICGFQFTYGFVSNIRWRAGDVEIEMATEFLASILWPFFWVAYFLQKWRAR